MAFIIVGAILALVGFVAFIAAKAATSKDGKDGGYAVTGLAVVGFIILTLVCSTHTVGSRQVGVVKNFAGQVTGNTGTGVVFTAPWSSVAKENTGLQKTEFSLNGDDAAVSQDQQQIFADVQLNYEVEPTDVVNLYKTVGPTWKDILLESRVLQDFKQVTSQYTAAEITTKRAQLRIDTKVLMTKELDPYGIKVVDVLIKNIGFSNAYRDAVTQKTIQHQKALQAEAKVAQSTAEAEQNVAIANGQAKATLVKAQAEAKALDVKGAAIKRNPGVIALEAIDKLSPQAKIVYCSGSQCPSFLPNLDGTSQTSTTPNK